MAWYRACAEGSLNATIATEHAGIVSAPASPRQAALGVRPRLKLRTRPWSYPLTMMESERLR